MGFAAGALTILFAISWTALGERRVDPQTLYFRLLCVMPLTGKGTLDDPKRPLHAPLPPLPGALPSRNGILAYAFEISDDGQFALVEYVARDRAAFRDILAETNPNVKIFEKSKHKRDVVEKEFKKHKKNFDLTRFAVIVP